MQGDWIVAGTQRLEKFSLSFYRVSCKNTGYSKDSLLTEASNFAIVFGQDLDREVGGSQSS